MYWRICTIVTQTLRGHDPDTLSLLVQTGNANTYYCSEYVVQSISQLSLSSLKSHSQVLLWAKFWPGHDIGGEKLLPLAFPFELRNTVNMQIDCERTKMMNIHLLSCLDTANLPANCILCWCHSLLEYSGQVNWQHPTSRIQSICMFF